MEKNGHRPSGYEQRAWHIKKMAALVEADAARQRQRYRNQAMVGQPVPYITQVLFQSGEIRTRKIIVDQPA